VERDLFLALGEFANLLKKNETISFSLLKQMVYTGLFEMIVGILTTCHTQ